MHSVMDDERLVVIQEFYEHAPCGFLAVDDAGVVQVANATVARWVGEPLERIEGRRRFADLLTARSRIYHETHLAPLLPLGRVADTDLMLRCGDDRQLPVIASASAQIRAAGHTLSLITLVDRSRQQRAEGELASSRHRTEWYAGRLGTLDRVVSDLSLAAAVDEVCAVLTSAAVQAFGAEAALLWLRNDETRTLAARAAHGVPDTAPGERNLPLTSLPRDPQIRRGETVVERLPLDRSRFPDLAAHLADGLDDDAERQLVFTPLAARGRTLGVLAARFDHSHELDHSELGVLRTLGHQTALAAERAQLFEQQHDVSQTLQRSLLPHRLPRDPRIQVATQYRAAQHALEVGGDWFDSFTLDRDRIAIVVGDVVGRGVHAAAAMGQLRSAIRALAVVDPRPEQMVEYLDRFVDDVPAARTATLVYAVLHLADGRVEYACAGHPPPVLVDDAGRPHLLWGGRSAPLGARFGAGQRKAAEVLLMPGSRLLLYTDGLVERRDQALEDRLARLLDEVTQWEHAPVEQLLDHTVDRMLRGAQVQDDICVLALAYRETAIFERTVMAHRPNLADLRHQLSDWLTEQQVPPEAQPAVVLCCSEAVANSIEHGYADDPHGAVHVIADLRGDRLQLRVEDRGTWRPPRPVGHRGRGLQLMRQLMNDVDVDTGTGTVVTMHHRLVNVEDR